MRAYVRVSIYVPVYDDGADAGGIGEALQRRRQRSLGWWMGRTWIGTQAWWKSGAVSTRMSDTISRSSILVAQTSARLPNGTCADRCSTSVTSCGDISRLSSLPIMHKTGCFTTATQSCSVLASRWPTASSPCLLRIARRYTQVKNCSY